MILFFEQIVIMMQARYLTGYSRSERTLVQNIKKYFSDLDAVYDNNFRTNPANNQRVAEGQIDINYELIISIRWLHSASNPTLLSFDIESPTNIDIPMLNELIEIPAQKYFGQLTLVYSSCGRSRNLETFPFFFDLENVVRELIINIMLSCYGVEWWDKAGIDNNLKKKASGNRKNELKNLLHDCFEFHPIFYLDLKDLKKIIEDEDQKHPTRLPFASIFENHDKVSVIDRIGEARELRNRVMHGKYLTEGNLRTIQVICSQLHRFLVQKGLVGDFRERKLISK